MVDIGYHGLSCWLHHCAFGIIR